MVNEPISEVRIDEAGRLLLRLSGTAFDDLHMAGAWGFRWDVATECLAAPKPIQWSYTAWFRHIVEIIGDQYDIHLRLESVTEWTDVPDDIRRELETLSGS
ncbi:MAG: hypothetical protein ACJ8EI_03955 [Sphingomicrobium sp.]